MKQRRDRDRNRYGQSEFPHQPADNAPHEQSGMNTATSERLIERP